MKSSELNPLPPERRTLHALIAICVIVLAQINLALHPKPAPAAKNDSVPKSMTPLVKHSPEKLAAQNTRTLPLVSTASPPSDSVAPIALASATTIQPLPEPVPTAFALIREGNKYLSKRSQGKIVQMISEKTDDGLTPNDWRVVYYDPEARFKAVEVRFAGEELTRIFEPGRILQLFSRRARQPMAENLLRVDSDEALTIALRRSGLNERMAEKSQLKLETSDEGVPVWRVNFWGRVQKRETSLGEVVISATDGSLIKNRIKASPVPDLLSDAGSKILGQKRL